MNAYNGFQMPFNHQMNKRKYFCNPTRNATKKRKQKYKKKTSNDINLYGFFRMNEPHVLCFFLCTFEFDKVQWFKYQLKWFQKCFDKRAFN